MVSHYFTIIFIASALYSIGGTDVGSFCPFPPRCHRQRPFCISPNPSEALNTGEVKPSSVQPSLSPEWTISRAVEEPAPPNSDLVTPLKEARVAIGTPPKKTPHVAEESAVPNSPRYAP
ncbi:hypothetical protein ACJRO7_035604 [Eucalyptus globulus]|uniref:Secreted protein n=1 Tax=Eucalyptus globulus TaxID=34317 RepID=A0ABD3J9A5_EUCGL